MFAQLGDAADQRFAFLTAFLRLGAALAFLPAERFALAAIRVSFLLCLLLVPTADDRFFMKRHRLTEIQISNNSCVRAALGFMITGRTGEF